LSYIAAIADSFTLLVLKTVAINVPGFSRQAMGTLMSVVERYPGEIIILNDLGVKCLLAGQQEEARKAFTEVRIPLLTWPH